MGSIGSYRQKGLTDREFFSGEFGDASQILDCASIGSVFYAAVKNLNSQEVFAVVMPYSRDRNGYFVYKDQDETMGPYDTECPARILDLLTPTDYQYANEWRAKCRERVAQKLARPKVLPGDTVIFRAPWHFSNGEDLDTLTFVKRNRFKYGYRLPNGWKDRVARIIPA